MSTILAIVAWAGKVMLAAIIGRAALEAFHILNLYPEVWLANVLLGRGERQVYAAIGWALVAIVALSLLVVEHRFRVTGRVLGSIWPTSHKSADDEDLRRLPSGELRNRAISMANDMRSFEASDRGIRSELAMERMRDIAQAVSEQQKSALLHQHDVMGEKRRAAYQQEALTRLRPTALAIRDELYRRLAIFPPYDRGQKTDVFLDHSMLAGVSPLTESADEIERLARRLP